MILFFYAGHHCIDMCTQGTRGWGQDYENMNIPALIYI